MSALGDRFYLAVAFEGPKENIETQIINKLDWIFP